MNQVWRPFLHFEFFCFCNSNVHVFVAILFFMFSVTDIALLRSRSVVISCHVFGDILLTFQSRICFLISDLTSKHK